MKLASGPVFTSRLRRGLETSPANTSTVSHERSNVILRLAQITRQSVQDELERQIGSDRIGQPDRSSPTIRIAHDRVSQNGGGGRRTGRQATEKQLRFVHRLAASISELDDHTLATLCERMFNAQLDNLSSVDASGLIDTLRAISEGKLTLDRLLNRGSVDDAQ